MSKLLIFDAGPMISLTLNNLLWILGPLRAKFDGTFCIPSSVRVELIDRPLETKKYKFEALQILTYIDEGVIEIVDNQKVQKKAKEISDLANTCFKAHGQWIKIVHPGEMETVAMALMQKADAIVVDERTTRLLIENPRKIKRRLERKLHTNVFVDEKKLERVHRMVRDIPVIRSIELVTIAFENGFLNKYMLSKEEFVKNIDRAVLEGVLWGLKLNGASVSEDEIKEIVSMEHV